MKTFKDISFSLQAFDGLFTQESMGKTIFWSVSPQLPGVLLETPQFQHALRMYCLSFTGNVKFLIYFYTKNQDV